MRVRLLSHDLSSNAAGRAFILAKALESFADVDLWGPASKRELWGPLRGSEMTTRVLPQVRVPGATSAARSLAPHLSDVDVVYAMKPLYGSYGVARRACKIAEKPLVLDIDDWELGFRLSGGVRWKVRAEGALRWRDPLGYFPTAALDSLAQKEPRKTVSNEFLRQRFGGIIVPHGRDLSVFDPRRFDAAKLKRSFGLDGKKVVLFFGTPRRHKGIDVLLDASRRLKDPKAVVAVVGAGEGDPFSDSLRAQAAADWRVKVFGEVPFERAPEVLAMADVVVVPQLAESGTIGQIPAKLGDAMSMGKAVVASSVGDIPRVGGDTVVLVPPGDPQALATALDGLLSDERRRSELGRRARERASRELSVELMTERLRQAFAGLG